MEDAEAAGCNERVTRGAYGEQSEREKDWELVWNTRYLRSQKSATRNTLTSGTDSARDSEHFEG